MKTNHVQHHWHLHLQCRDDFDERRIQ